MAYVMPTIPRFVMTIFEPISLVAGFFAAIISPEWFIAEQIPLSTLKPLTANARMVALQLGNIYLLLAMVGIAVLWSTTEAKVVRNYVIALWIADIGHVVITCYMMEYKRLLDIANWNAMAYGNIVTTAFLFSVRTGYLLSLFGPDLKPKSSTKKLR